MNLPRLIRAKEVTRLTGLTRSHIYLLMSKGRFPSMLKLDEKAVAWREDEVNAWVETRIRLAQSGIKRGPGRPPKNRWPAPTSA